MKTNPKVIAWAVIAVICIIIIIQNTQAVRINLLFFSFTMPNALLLFLTLLLGFVLGIIMPYTVRRR